VCDGWDLGAANCVGLGYASGNLSCASNCLSFDTSECVGTLDTEYPIFSNFNTTPVNNTAYSSETTYKFNVTITSTNGTAGIAYNGVNYTASNLSIAFNSSVGDLAAGTYSYYWWAYGNGTDENYNTSGTRYYTVAQSTGEINGTINGTQGNFSATNGTANQNIWLNATNMTGYGTGKIYMNGTLYNSGTLPLANLTNLSIGFYNITFEYDGNINYSSDSEVWWVNITLPVDTTYPTFSNYQDNNASLINSGMAMFNVTITNTNITVFLSINNNNYSASNLSSNLYNVSLTLTNGTYSYYWGSWGNGTDNNYNTSQIRYYTVNASPLSDNPPTITLGIPEDNYINQTKQYVNITFTASIIDDYNIQNCSIWHNVSGTWKINQTQNLTGTANTTQFSLNLTNTSFIWNIRCYDNASQANWSLTNRSVILNYSAPDTIAPGAPSFTGNNITAGTDGNLDLVWGSIPDTLKYMIFRNTSNFTLTGVNPNNLFLANVTSETFEDNTTLHGLNYWYRIVSVDTSNNYNLTNASQSHNVTVNDSIKPSSPTNMNATQSGNTVTLVWSNILYDVQSNADFSGLKYQIWQGTSINMSKIQVNDTLSFLKNVTFDAGNSTTYELTSTNRYYFVATTIDDANNANSSFTTENLVNLSLTYSPSSSSSSSSGGGGGGGGGGAVPASNFQEFEQGQITHQGKERSVVKYMYGGNSHTVTFDAIREDSVDLIIKSFFIKDTLFLKQTKTYNIEGDMDRDISITLEEISNQTANISIRRLDYVPSIEESPKPIKEPAESKELKIVEEPAQEDTQVKGEAPSQEQQTKKSFSLILTLSMLGALILFILIIILSKNIPNKQKTKKSSKEIIKGTVNLKLQKYIIKCLKSGYSRKKTQNACIRAGWSEKTVNNTLKSIK